MNISALNVNKSEELYKTNSVNIKSNTEKKDANGVNNIFDNTTVSSAEKMSSTKVDGKGLASMMEDAGSVEEQLKNSAAAAKDSLKALFNKMTGTDCVQMDEDGYDLNDMDAKDIVTVVDRIKIMLATYCKDYEATGEPVDISEIKSVVGNTGMANQVASKLKSADIPVTQDNIDEVKTAVAQAKEITPLSEDAKKYLVSNKLEPSIQNIYKAEHASNSSYTGNSSTQASSNGSSKTSNVSSQAGVSSTQANSNSSSKSGAPQISEQEWKQLRPQVETIITKAGLEVDENSLNNAKTFIESGIPVNEENLVYKNELDKLDLSSMNTEESTADILTKIVDNMKAGNTAGSTLLTDGRSLVQTVADAISTLNIADIAEVAVVTDQDQTFSVANLRSAIETTGQSGYSSDLVQTGSIVQATASATVSSELFSSVTSTDAQAVTNYRQLEEIRILMTAQAGMSLAKQGFNLDTTPIADLVERLRAMEAELYGDDANTVYEVQKAVNDIKNAPDVMIGAVLADKATYATITMADFSQMGNNLKQKFRQAEQTYETVGTEVRADLGDSISKAVNASTDTILSDLGLENTKANRDAVRILGYNGMEMTEDNILSVKEIYSTLNNLIDNMKPETALSMIRSGLNPMNADIKDVNEYLVEENEGTDSADKFSKFLYKLERTEGITDEEREKFIGIYKMMNIFRKDAGRAVGTLLKQDADITMSNLMTAYNSNKAAGIDTSVDDTTGMAEISGTVNYYNNLFAATAESITPKTLKTVNEERAIETRSVENFCESVDEAYDSKNESEYYEQYLKEISNVADVEDSIIRQLTSNEQKVSIDNILALQNIMSSNYFQKYMKNGSEVSRDARDASDLREISDVVESFIEKTGSEDDLNAVYEQLDEAVRSATNEAVESTSTYSDIERLRMMGKEIGLIKNLGQRHDYKIPFVADGEVGTINLKIVEDSEDRGRISIRFTTGSLGNVSIEGRISGDSAGIFALTDGDADLLAAKISSATENISEELGIEKCDVHVNKSNEIPNVSYKTDDNEISLKTLYGLAKTLVVGLVKPS